MTIYEIGNYKQIVKKGNITCTCRFGTIFCNNYKTGDKVCRHIKELIKLLLRNDMDNLNISK